MTLHLSAKAKKLLAKSHVLRPGDDRRRTTLPGPATPSQATVTLRAAKGKH